MRVAATASAICLSIIGLVSAGEVRASIPQPTAISAQSLGSALQTLAKDRDFQVLYRTEVVGKLRTKGIAGRFTTEEALGRLLEGTGLTYRYLDPNTVMIVPVIALQSATGAQADSQSLPAAVADDAQPQQDGQKASPGHFRVAQAAQGAAAGTSSPADAGALASATSGPGDLEEVVVTGSRVLTNGNDSPTPLTVISAQELQATQSSTVTQGLMDLPQFAGSRGPTAAAAGTAGGTNGANNSQIAALSLEGLGPNRTLVLYDGHRVPYTEQIGLVDANTIPQMLLQRVDIVTGGASAVYGSDAIGGVVNFITDRNFNGVKVDLQGGITQKGLDPTSKFGIAFGTSLFGGRGHFEGSFESQYDGGILHRNTVYGSNDWYILGNGTAQFPYFLANNVVNTVATFGGKIVGPAKNPLLNDHFDPTNGVLSPFTLGSTAGLPNTSFVVGGDGAYWPYTTLAPQVDLNQLYARFDYDLSDNVHYYLSAAGTLDHEQSFTTDTNIMNYNIGVNNAFLPLAYQQQMQAAGITTFGFSEGFGPGSTVPAQSGDFYTRSLYINTGVEGKLAQYKWDVSYTRSAVSNEVINNYTYNNGRLFAALDAVINPANGQIVCNVTLTNPGLYPGCVPINLFGPTATSQAASDYIREVMDFRSHLPTDDVSASITGAPFRDWAGPVNMALSGEWRSQGFDLISSQPTVNFAPLNCTGLRFANCTTPTASNPGTAQDNNSVAGRPLVSQTVKEGALEVGAPLVKDLWLAQAVNVDLAYRYATYTINGNGNITAPNYDSYFNSDTWKAGLDWHFNDMVTVRATRSRDFRAPNLNDLYGPMSITTGGANTDLWTNSNLNPAGQNPNLVAGGNANLKPEVGYTSTVGVVLKPTQNFSVAVDYFKVEITNYIATINGATPAIQTSCYASGGTSPYCSLQARPFPLSYSTVASVNAVTTWYTVPLNIADMQTQGVNLEVNYKAMPFGHPLALRGLVAYQPHILLIQPAVPTQELAGQENGDSPRTRVTLMAHYNPTPRFAIDWQTRWRDSLRFITLATQYALPDTNVPSVFFSDMTLSYQLDGPFSGQSQVFLNIQDVFNQKAPIAGASSGTPVPGGFAYGDDPFGRAFTLGIRYRL